MIYIPNTSKLLYQDFNQHFSSISNITKSLFLDFNSLKSYFFKLYFLDCDSRNDTKRPINYPKIQLNIIKIMNTKKKSSKHVYRKRKAVLIYFSHFKIEKKR